MVLAVIVPTGGFVLAGLMVALAVAVFAGKVRRSFLGFLLGSDPDNRSRSVMLSVVELCAALLVALLAIYSIVRSGWAEETRREEAAEVQRRTVALQRQIAQQVEAQQRAMEALRADAPAAAREIAAALAEAEQQMRANNFDGARSTLERAAARRQQFLGLAPVPSDLAALSPRLDDRRLRVERVLAFEQNAARVRDLIERATRQASDQDWLAADESYAQALSAADGLAGSTDRAGHDLEQLRSAIERQRGRIARQVERARLRKAADDLYVRRCGPRPDAGGWDGDILGFEAAVRRTAHDPDSVDVENCTRPVLTERDCWQSYCDVRGTNAFGARVLNHFRFHFRTANGAAVVTDIE